MKKNNAQAEIWFKKVVALGSMSARNSLGAFYGRGLGLQPDDRDKVLPLIEASACQGYAPAQINLASFYTENDGEAPVDYKKAMHGIMLLLLMVRKMLEVKLTCLPRK